MTDRPIIFSAPMIRALLDGRKTQTRRMAWQTKEVIVTEAELAWLEKRGWEAIDGADDITTIRRLSPWQDVRVGDRLWVREAAAVRYESWNHVDGHSYSVSYRAAEDDSGRHLPGYGLGQQIRTAEAPSHFPSRSFNVDGRLRWAPSIHMPRWASRLTLVVTEVRRQRLQDISCADAIAEGIAPAANSQTIDCETSDPREAFAAIWNHLHGAEAWAANPEVVVLSFEVHRCNIDQMPASKGEAA